MEENEYPGQCEGMYSPDAEECQECDIAEQCKRITENDNNDNNVRPDDDNKGKHRKTT